MPSTVQGPITPSNMRFMPRSLSSKLWPKNPKKSVVGGLKDGTKLLASGLMFGGGMEIAGAIARKSQSAETDNGAQYISFTDLGPSIARFDSVDANTNAPTRPWLFGSRHIFGIPTFILTVLIVIMCSFCWRRVRCLAGLRWCCKPPKKVDDPSHPATTHPSSPTCEAVDMEAEMEILEFDTMNPARYATMQHLPNNSKKQ